MSTVEVSLPDAREAGDTPLEAILKLGPEAGGQQAPRLAGGRSCPWLLLLVVPQDLAQTQDSWEVSDQDRDEYVCGEG